jgi:hypothetical protein
VIRIKYRKNKNYIIYFSKINSQNKAYDNEATHIYFYYDLDIEIMKNKQYICYDFKRIINSYTKLPEVLKEFDYFAFYHYGLKFIDVDYF